MPQPVDLIFLQILAELFVLIGMIGIDVKDQQVLLAEIRHFGRLVAGVVNLDGGDFLFSRTGRLAANGRRQSQRQDHRPNDIQLFHELHVLNRTKLPTKAVKRNFSVGS